MFLEWLGSVGTCFVGGLAALGFVVALFWLTEKLFPPTKSPHEIATETLLDRIRDLDERKDAIMRERDAAWKWLQRFTDAVTTGLHSGPDAWKYALEKLERLKATREVACDEVRDLREWERVFTGRVSLALGIDRIRGVVTRTELAEQIINRGEQRGAHLREVIHGLAATLDEWERIDAREKAKIDTLSTVKAALERLPDDTADAKNKEAFGVTLAQQGGE